MNVPLIQKPETNDINASLIAIRKQLQILNESVNNIESKYLLKSELKELSADTVGGDGKYIESISESNGIINAVEKSLGNMTPVDTVTSGNMHSVTSNAVAKALKHYPDVTYYNSAQSANLNCNDITDRVCLVTALMSNWASLNYPFQGLMFIITAKNEVGDGFQKAISWGLDGTFPEFTRVCKNGVWQSWQNIVLNNDLGDSLGEQRIGTWIDGSPLYKKVIVFNVPQNGEYSVPINVVNLKNVVNWRGNFFQSDYQNPAWIMHIPYTFFDSNNLANMINIYGYYLPSSSAFQFNFYGSGVYANSYFNGQAILYIQYTKNS